MSSQVIEKKVGDIKINSFNLFVENILDMELLEYYEDRLERLEEPYAITYRSRGDGKIVYSIYCNTRKKGSKFK